ncbi:MAG: zinc-ribbon domain-containing protein [Thermoplasmata archaeon]
MTKFCPVCGTPNEDSAHFCVRCGYNFDQQSNLGQTAQPFQQNIPSVNIPPSDNLLYNLDSLRSAFFWLFIGSILSIIPIINFIGAIIVFIGFILLIIGFGKISKTSLRNAGYYRSTRNWLLVSIIFGLLVIAVDIVAVILLYSTVAITTTPLPSSYGSNLLILLGAVGIMGIIYIIIYLVAYIKVIKSLKFLSEDLQVRKLHSAGNYLLYSLVVNIISIVLLPILLFLSISAIAPTLSSGLTTQSLTVLLGALAVPIVIIIIAYILQLIGYHSAYTGIDEFKSRYNIFVPPPVPPAQPPYPPVQ